MTKPLSSVLVIGGTGFVGSALVAELSSRSLGKISVVHSSPLKSVKPSSALYYRMSMGDAAIKDLIDSHDAIVILTQPDTSAMRHFADMFEDTSARHILYASTVLLYNISDRPAKESDPVTPHSPYEHDKLEEEKILQTAAKSAPLTIARLANVYGDILNRGIIGKALHALYRDEGLAVSGNAVRDYIFIDDVAEALAELALKPGNAERIVNVSTGKGTSLEEVLAHIETITGQRIQRLLESASESENAWSVANNDAATEFLRKPRSLLQGLKETSARFAAWYDSPKV